MKSRSCTNGMLLFSAVLLLLIGDADCWGGNGNSAAVDDSAYGNTFVRDWLYDSKSLSISVEGCAWGYVEDSEAVGCMQDESEDGTTNWYMMANCRRPQVVFSVYASNSGSTSCNNNNFVGSVSGTKLVRCIFHDDVSDRHCCSL